MPSGDVRWIKIVVDIFNDEKILYIEQLPEADAIINIWFKLLCFAGRSCSKGVLLVNEAIPCTEQMLSAVFRRPVETVTLALSTFETLGMIERIDGVITIPNWGKHQSLDRIEKEREYQREYMNKRRAEQKEMITCEPNSKPNCKPNSKADVRRIELEVEEDKENIKRNSPDGETPSSSACQDIVDLFNSVCVSFPKVTKLSDTRCKAIKARLKQYSPEDFRILFEKAEGSSFLKGGNDRNWAASFDWLIKDSSFAKVLDGTYDDRSSKTNSDIKLLY